MPKISELPLANKLKEEDYIPIVQDGVTKKVKGTHFVTEEEYSLDAFSPTIAANDRTMYKFGEGDTVDFSDSAYDGAYKSAILKGNTLVNLSNTPQEVETTSQIAFPNVNIKPNTQYTILYQIKSSNELTPVSSVSMFRIENTIDGAVNTSNVIYGHTDIIKTNYTFKKVLVTSRSNAVSMRINVRNAFRDNGLEENTLSIKDLIILEGDYTNVDIPYFEGMKSVKMPVLKTTGKNLFDTVIENGIIDGTNGNAAYHENYGRTADYIKVNPNTDLIISSNGISPYAVFYYDENKKYIKVEKIPTFKFTTPNNCYFVKFTWMRTNIDISLITNIQLEEGSVATSYEPHKSNILTVNEDVELRGIGDVQDTLDCLTGEITENLIEVSVDSSTVLGGYAQPIGSHTNTSRYKINIKDTFGIDVENNYGLSDKIPYKQNDDDDFHFKIGHDKNACFIYVPKSELMTDNWNGFVEWAKNKDFKLLLKRSEKSIKTVDLSGTPFGYKGGHIIKSSAEGSLLPKFEYEVAVSRGAQISQNTSTLIKHDEKITELLKKTAATYINQKAEIAHLLNMSNTLEEVQTIPFIEDDYVNDDCMVDSDMVMDDMELEPEKEIIDNVDTLLINLIYDLIELNDTLDLSEKVELFRQSGLIDKHNYEIIKEKLNPTFKEEDYADINQ